MKDLTLINDEQFSAVYDVIEERQRQDKQWGGPEHDDAHDIWNWCVYIEKQVKRIEEDGYNGKERERFVKIAALAIAAIESIDRVTK